MGRAMAIIARARSCRRGESAFVISYSTRVFSSGDYSIRNILDCNHFQLRHGGAASIFSCGDAGKDGSGWVHAGAVDGTTDAYQRGERPGSRSHSHGPGILALGSGAKIRTAAVWFLDD